jgi:arabinogalactan endo-1,4-beta-galactosidase
MTTYGTRRAGKVAVFLTALKSVGVNYVRPRIWNNPRSGYNVCDRFKAQGSAPDSVQIGNEINTGMLWNDSKANVISSSQPCSGDAATPAGQAANFTAVQNTARGAGAIGIFYWEPTWYAVPGNGWDPADITNSGDGWENQAVLDRTGRLNPTIRWTA